MRDHAGSPRGLKRTCNIFDPSTIGDKATYTEPTQLSQGVKFVFVNGQIEFADGQLTGVKAGRPLMGPGVAGELP
jgi:N-acyl-D-aspartate/D-glutamate deacylase